MYVNSHTNDHSEKLETTQCSPMGEWFNKHLHNGISHNSQNKWITATHTQSLNLSTDIKWKKISPKISLAWYLITF